MGRISALIALGLIAGCRTLPPPQPATRVETRKLSDLHRTKPLQADLVVRD